MFGTIFAAADLSESPSEAIGSSSARRVIEIIPNPQRLFKPPNLLFAFHFSF